MQNDASDAKLGADPQRRYLSVEIPGTFLLVQVELDDEGVVLDVFNKKGEVIATNWKFYEDFGINNVEFGDEE